MARLLFNGILVGAACAAMLAPMPARADGGRIQFGGAVVAPTCAVTRQQVATVPGAESPRQSCSHAGAASVTSAYALSETELSPRSPDALLSYFATYVNSANPGATARLITQTYD